MFKFLGKTKITCTDCRLDCYSWAKLNEQSVLICSNNKCRHIVKNVDIKEEEEGTEFKIKNPPIKIYGGTYPVPDEERNEKGSCFVKTWLLEEDGKIHKEPHLIYFIGWETAAAYVSKTFIVYQGTYQETVAQ